MGRGVGGGLSIDFVKGDFAELKYYLGFLSYILVLLKWSVWIPHFQQSLVFLLRSCRNLCSVVFLLYQRRFH